MAMVMVLLPIMPMWFEGAIAVPIGPIGMATIGRVTIVTVTIAIGGSVMAITGKASAQGEQQEHHRKRQGNQAHPTPPLIHLGSSECHHASMAAAGQHQGIFMMPV